MPLPRSRPLRSDPSPSPSPSPVRRTALLLVGLALLVSSVTTGVPTAAAADVPDPPRMIAQNASAGELRWEPAIDFDTDSCYNVPAIGADGNLAQGLTLDGADMTAGCRDSSDLDNSNVYVRTRCNHGYCVHFYDYYFEKDVAIPHDTADGRGHRNDWEHLVVWTTDNDTRAVSVAVSGHGNFDRVAANAPEVVWQDGTHFRAVYNKDGPSTHRWRFATRGDDQAENASHTWRIPALLGWDQLGSRLRGVISSTSFGSASLAIKDASFEENVDHSRGVEQCVFVTNQNCNPTDVTPGFDNAVDGEVPYPSPADPNVHRADPSVVHVGSTYYAVEVDRRVDADHPGDPDHPRINLKSAGSVDRLAQAHPIPIWVDWTGKMKEVWAPKLTHIGNQWLVYFSAGAGSAHRMWAMSAASLDGPWSEPNRVFLPDDKWAIDGTAFQYNGQVWFTWSGWERDTNVEQNIYLAEMATPLNTTGGRFIVSQAREPWERVVGSPFINEAPTPVLDPNQQLHIVYSANGSWSDQYCTAEVRLKAGGDPTRVWDWYKSNGCLMGSNKTTLMGGLQPTRDVSGPGSISLVLENGGLGSTVDPASTHPMDYTAVPKTDSYSWDNRRWFTGAYSWWPGVAYTRRNVPGDTTNSGYALALLEHPGDSKGAPPHAPAAVPGQTGIHNQDPSVARVGSTYYSVESDGVNVLLRQASSPDDLGRAAPRPLTHLTADGHALWAPELVSFNTPSGRTWMVYFAYGRGDVMRMYGIQASTPGGSYNDPLEVLLPDNKWAVDGTAFTYRNQLYFTWSGWEGDTNVEQNVYLAKMTGPWTSTGPRRIISQAREPWERVVGNPFVNEAPEPLVDPQGQLHVVYSTNGSWSDQYCLGDLRLRPGGDPMYVWDWYKSNGCLFGSNRATMMAGWDPTLSVDGPGSLSFVLLDGDIATSPPAEPKFPSMYHAVPKGTPYSWTSREWFRGSFVWWGNTTYSRRNVPGDTSSTGFSLKFFEGDGPS